MSAGVSPVSPVTAASPADRTQYSASPISPSVPKAIAHGGTLDGPSAIAQDMTPSPPPDPTSGRINLYA